jgi:hypothetical protein
VYFHTAFVEEDMITIYVWAHKLCLRSGFRRCDWGAFLLSAHVHAFGFAGVYNHVSVFSRARSNLRDSSSGYLWRHVQQGSVIGITKRVYYPAPKWNTFAWVGVV